MPQTKTSPRRMMVKKKGKDDDEELQQHDEEEDLQQPSKKKTKKKNPPLKDDTNTKGTSSSNTLKNVPAKKSSSTPSRLKGKKATATKSDEEGDEVDVDDNDSVASTSSGSGKKKFVKKRKKKKRITAKKNDEDSSAADSDNDDDDEEPISKMAAKKQACSPPKIRKRKAKADAKVDDDDDDDGNESDQSSSSSSSPKKKKTTTTRKKAAAKASPKKKKKAKTTTKEPVQSITERDELPKLWSDEQAKENGSYTLRIASWNVAGLRAIIRKDSDALAKLVTEHNLDILCLQETKLQEIHLDDPKLKIRGHILEEEGYDSYYSCSTAKKGYAGTAVFVRRRGAVKKQKTLDSFFGGSSKPKGKKETSTTAAKPTTPVDPKQLLPERVTYELGVEKHDKEGRVICLEFPGFTMANLYVPNSGQKLDRLDYRTQEWDKDLVAFAKGKQVERGLPFMWLGDLNVAHKNLEAYNFGAKHLDKQAGLTPQERASFTEQLDSFGKDAFRHLHPTAKGHYSYWSQRAGNREPNKGLRLDYFVCDPSFFEEDSKVIARDSYMIPDQMGSDHCPVVLELEIKP